MEKRLVGASVWEEELYEHLVSHVENERDLLSAYQSAAAASDSPAFRYLASLIVEDELRHHRMFTELANALRSDVELRDQEPRVPRLDHWGSRSEQVLELTERLLGQEEADRRELRRIGKDLRDVGDTTLWQLLVRVMEADTEKHIQILSFVKAHARPSAR